MPIKRIRSWVERIRFVDLFGCWLILVILFGLLYYVLDARYDILASRGKEGFLNSIYFSFITSFPIGYGDVVPVGIGRFFAVIEGITGLIIYGIVISKLVSYKQESILNELYEISFEERLHRFRSALYLFRSDLSKFIFRVENNSTTQKQINDIWIMVNTLDVTLMDISKVLFKKVDREYIKKVDNLSLELIFNSIDTSLQKLLELVDTLEEKKLKWKTEILVENLGSIRNSIGMMIDNYKQFGNVKILNRIKSIGESYNRIKNVLEANSS